MPDDVIDGIGVGDEGDHVHGASAATKQGVHLEHPLDEPRPGGSSSSGEGRRVSLLRLFWWRRRASPPWCQVMATSVGADVPDAVLPGVRNGCGHRMDPVQYIQVDLILAGCGVARGFECGRRRASRHCPGELVVWSGSEPASPGAGCRRRRRAVGRARSTPTGCSRADAA